MSDDAASDAADHSTDDSTDDDGIPLPMFCIAGRRPVWAFETESGGMDIEAYNWETGEFERDFGYLTRIFVGDVDYVTEEEFIDHVRTLRRELHGRTEDD